MKVKNPFEVPYEGNELTRAARYKIDCDISELKRRIKDLKTKRNELSPIHVLPPEVLSTIFVLVRDLSGSLPSVEDQPNSHQAPWIRVGHVCHHWSEVALNCPSLWSIPVFTRPSLAQEMIQRSKTAPLTIELPPGTLTWETQILQPLRNALTQIQRIQSIKLPLSEDTHLVGDIHSSLSTPQVPLLRSLSVKLGISSSHPFSFPLNALSDAPCLHSVEFCFLNFSWNSAVFRHGNLTSLRIGNNMLWGTSTISQMMDALHHLPKLRILELTNAIPSHATSNGSEKVVELKFLEQLVLGAEAPDCIFLLRHLHYPSHAMVRLQSYNVTGIEDSRTITSFLGQNLCRTHSTEAGVPHCPVVIRSARLTFDGLMICGITFFNTIDDETPHIPFGQSDPIIQIHLRSSFAFGHVHLLTNIYNCFDLSSLEHLVLNWTSTDDHARAIQDTFGKLPRLKTISILQSHSIIRSILHNGSFGGAETQTSPPVACFPALKTLIFEDVDFKQSTIVQHLILALEFRTHPKINMPLDRLIFKNRAGALTEYGERLLEWARVLIMTFVSLAVYVEVNGGRYRVLEGLKSDDQSNRGDSGDGGEGQGVEEEHHSNEDEDESGSSDQENSSDEGEEEND